MKMKVEYFKKGDRVICIDDDSEDEDFGMSGHVLHGRRDLTEGKEYIVESIDTRHVPTDLSHWEEDEHEYIKYVWTMLFLKGIGPAVWAKHFKKSKPDSSQEKISKKDFINV